VELGLIVLLVVTQWLLLQQIPDALWVLTASLLLRTLHHIILQFYLLSRRRKAVRA
jgi:hypothetical protein